MRKFVFLLTAMSVAFFVGYGVAVKAYPAGGVYGRAEHRGFFTNVHDDWGVAVLPAFPSYGGNAFPTTMDTATEFINFVKYAKLDIDGNGSDRQERTGAAFLIHTMVGSGAANRSRPPSAAQIQVWEDRIREAEAAGRISWFYNFSYNINSYFQGETGGAGTNDDAFYDETGTSSTIVFRNSSGQVVFAIRRQCANPVGNGSLTSLPPVQPPVSQFTMSGRTILSAADASPVPGQTITFGHLLRNNGPSATGTTTINWVSQSMPGASATGSGNSGTYAANLEKRVSDELVTVPNNAANGMQICRRVGWAPTSHAVATTSYGAPVCATVQIPAKLKAAMSVAPPTMGAGDTATFTPVISASNNGTPVTANCSITRTLYPPTGASSSLGTQQCVTTSGDTNIVVGTGASVILRANSYVAPNNIPTGSRICDVITITNPTLPAYYDSPADRTAEACVTIAKAPYVHFIGDVWAGGGFAAVAPGTCNNQSRITTITRAQPLSDGSRPGSGTTYAAFALGKITNFGSASMALTTTTGDNWTFANTNTANLGFFNSGQHCIPDYVAAYQTAPVVGGGSINVGGGASGSYRINGNASFQGGVGSNQQKVYLVNGNVTIANNVTYPANFNASGGLPSLVIIATGDIYVNGNVTQMDGIFISRGTFYTCYPKVEPATINTCNQRLTVNGSVMANRVDLFRTAGADGATPANQKTPAELFNLSPEVFLSNALNQTAQPTVTTNELRELPPRF